MNTLRFMQMKGETKTNMEKINIDEVMETIFKSESLEIVREALEFWNSHEEYLSTNLKNDRGLDLHGVYGLEIDKNRNGNLNLVTIGNKPEVVLEFQNNKLD